MVLCYQGLGAWFGVGELPYTLHLAWVGWSEGVQCDVDGAEKVEWNAVEEVGDVAEAGDVGCGGSGVVAWLGWPVLVAGA